MKPGGDLESDMEEEVEANELFRELGMLIVEGRIPEESPKGRREGPHCPVAPGELRPHECLPQHDQLCKKTKEMSHQMMMLWRNNIPMCIEVLLYPNCEHGQQLATAADVSLPGSNSGCLLEQWVIQAVPKRLGDTTASFRALFQALRSWLHFSEISAWLNLSHGTQPKNLAYRISPPGEFCTNSFQETPHWHTFPICAVSKVTAIRVTVGSLPRSQRIIHVPCNDPSHGTAPAKAELHPPHEYADQELLHSRSPSSRSSTPTGRSSGSSTPTYGRCSNDNLSEKDVSSDDSETCLSPRNVCGLDKARLVPISEDGGTSYTGASHRPSLNSMSSCDPYDKLPGGRARELSEGGAKPKRPGCVPYQKLPKSPQDIDALDCDRFLRKTVDFKSLKSPKVLLSKKSPAFNFYSKTSVSNTDSSDSENSSSPDMDLFLMSLTLSKERLTPSDYEEHLAKLAKKKTRAFSPLAKDLRRQFDELFIDSKHHSPKGQISETLKCASVLKQWKKTGEEEPPHTNCQTQTDNTCQISNEKHTPHNNHTCQPEFNQICHKSGQGVNKHQNDTQNGFTPAQPKSAENGFSHEDAPVHFSVGENGAMPPIADITNNHKLPDTPTKLSAVRPASMCLPSRAYASTDNLDNVSDESTKGSTNRPMVIRSPTDAVCVPGFSGFNRGTALFKSLVRRELKNQGKTDSTSVVPSSEEQAAFQQSFHRSTSLIFSSRSGLPLQSSPAPVKKNTNSGFHFDESLTNPKAIKNSLSCVNLGHQDAAATDDKDGNQKLYSTSAPASTNRLLGNFEESVLNGRIEPCGVIEGFKAEIGASGAFCPKHIELPVTAFFFSLSDDNAPSPYLGHINLESLGKRGYHIPKRGTVQVTLFNPNGTVVKMFVVMYNLEDMPPNCQTFLRQRTLYMPTRGSPEEQDGLPSYMRYLIHLRFASSKSSKIYLHTDIRLIFARDKFEFDSRVANYELRSFTEGPVNPKYSPKR